LENNRGTEEHEPGTQGFHAKCKNGEMRRWR